MEFFAVPTVRFRLLYWVGSCKREVIDHVTVLDEDHLRRLLREYVGYDNAERVHTPLQDSPQTLIAHRTKKREQTGGCRSQQISRVSGRSTFTLRLGR